MPAWRSSGYAISSNPGSCFSQVRAVSLRSGIDEPELKIIDVFICKVRNKLVEATDGQHYIHTDYGRGYTLRYPKDGEAQAAA